MWAVGESRVCGHELESFGFNDASLEWRNNLNLKILNPQHPMFGRRLQFKGSCPKKQSSCNLRGCACSPMRGLLGHADAIPETPWSPQMETPIQTLSNVLSPNQKLSTLTKSHIETRLLNPPEPMNFIFLSLDPPLLLY